MFLGGSQVSAILAAARDGEAVREARVSYREVAQPLPHRFAPVVDAEVRYLDCPSCEAPMHRTRVLAGSGVIVDVCAAHGVWFDPGEVDRLRAALLGAAQQAVADDLDPLERVALVVRAFALS